MQVSTPGNLTVSGSLIANGENDGYAHGRVLAFGGPGGGGSGGTIELHAHTLEISSNATITAKGGIGGGVSTTANSTCGADASFGYLTLNAENYNISPLANIHHIAMKPHPFGLKISFANTNEQYQLQFTDSLTSNHWNNIGLPLLPGIDETNRAFTDISTAGATNRFYRLLTLPTE